MTARTVRRYRVTDAVGPRVVDAESSLAAARALPPRGGGSSRVQTVFRSGVAGSERRFVTNDHGYVFEV